MLYYTRTFIFLLSISLGSAEDCSCGACQVVDCGEGQDACEALDGDASCVSGATDWVCKMDEACDSGDCDDICEKSQCYQANCGISEEVCFHRNSVITYKGTKYTFEELVSGAEAECVVPHVPISLGVKVLTACGKSFRVTDTHLIATERGFQYAHSLKEGDLVHEDYEGKELCAVVSAEKEPYPQQYFGLNCLHSEVLVDGIRASTFGDLHTVPALYMQYAGSIFGVKAASEAGIYFSKFYHYISSGKSFSSLLGGLFASYLAPFSRVSSRQQE